MKKRELKKFIFPLVFMGVFSYLPKNHLALAEDSPKQLEQMLSVGDSMPVSEEDYTEITLETSKGTIIKERVYSGEEEGQSRLEVYKVCNGITMKKPFAIIQHGEKKILYIDNKNKAGQYLPDGIIDEIPDMVEIKEKGRYQFHSPECGEEI